ncbi:hypothetical protein BDZ45DRAFT_154533 [Acephala macrosclerotiorum]|nr:hypothetical protein BDZ45DRAFT_154533 [Acephala macrosclerotiorum]
MSFPTAMHSLLTISISLPTGTKDHQGVLPWWMWSKASMNPVYVSQHSASAFKEGAVSRVSGLARVLASLGSRLGTGTLGHSSR